MRRRSILALSIAAALAVTACGGGDQAADETPTATEPEPAPETEPTGPAATQAPAEDPLATGAEQVTAFFTRDSGNRLWVEPETHDLDQPTVAVARAAIGQLLEGETTEPALGTFAPAGTRILGIDVEDGILVVDLSGEVRQSTAGAAGEATFAQQLAHTATQFEGIRAVRLWVDGQPVDELWGHLDWSQPIEPDPFALSPVIITQPVWGSAQAPGPVRAAGTASTFEATVELRLLAPDGSVAEETFTTATCGMGCRGDWEHTFSAEVTRPGPWVVEAMEPDPSDGQEGFPPVVDRVQFNVR
jgi:spore germination protein GerM